MSDFIAPKGVAADYIGQVVVGIFGSEKLSEKYEEENDRYSAIMVKVLAGRFAEAFTEEVHRLIRTDYWGYALKNQQLLLISFRWGTKESVL